MARKSTRTTSQPRRRQTQSTKPVFGLGTIITVLLFAGLILFEVILNRQKEAKAADATPTNSGYYVRLDNGKIRIAGLSGIDALTNLIVSPPYLNTPTPSPLPPTETPTPGEATVTPTP